MWNIRDLAKCVAALIWAGSALAQQPGLGISTNGQVGISNGISVITPDGKVGVDSGFKVRAGGLTPVNSAHGSGLSVEKMDDADDDGSSSRSDSYTRGSQFDDQDYSNLATKLVWWNDDGQSECYRIDKKTGGRLISLKQNLEDCKKPATKPVLVMVGGYSECHEVDVRTGGRNFLRLLDPTTQCPGKPPTRFRFEHFHGSRQTICHEYDIATGGKRFHSNTDEHHCSKPQTHFLLSPNPEENGKMVCTEADIETNGDKYFGPADMSACRGVLDPSHLLKDLQPAKSQEKISVSDQKSKPWEWILSIIGFTPKAPTQAGSGR